MDDHPVASAAETLQVALRLVDALKLENETYRKDYEKLNEAHTQLLETYERQSQDFVAEKTAFQNQINEMDLYWKNQMEIKASELKKKRVTDPKEIEMIKLQVTTDLEAAYTKKIERMENETEKLKHVIYSLKRENELMREDAQNKVASSFNTTKDLHTEHVEEIAAFEAKIKELQECLDLLADSDQVRNLQRDNTELTLKLQNVTSELEEVRSRKELATVEYEQKERLIHRRLLEEMANAKTIRIEKDALLVKVNSLQDEVRSGKKLHETSTEEATVSKKEVLKIKSLLEETRHHSSVELNDLKVTHIKAIKSLDIQINDLRTKILDGDVNLKNAVETIADLRVRLGASEQNKIDKVREAHEEESARINKLLAEKAGLEHQIAELQKLLDQVHKTEENTKRDLDEEITRLKRANHAQISTNNTLTSENKSLSCEIQSLAGQLSSEQSRLKELADKLQTALLEKQDADHEIDTLNDRIVHLEESLQGTRMESVQKDENLIKEEQAFKHNLDLYRSTWAAEKEKLRAHVTMLSADNIRLTENEENLRKNQEIFITKTTQMKRKLNSLKTENQKLAAMLEANQKQEQQRQADVSRKHQMFVSLLAEEGALSY
ncbi:UNVERIFIED_CONTAM: Centrosomal protein of 83 kDa [Siphonaria sp. JEL0065]|nr:Centrosomal protein of 83 kDa [Siphonaria sp. JEL0065]